MPGLEDVIRYLHIVCAIDVARDLTDRELLERFLTQREESAFACLVQRHGPMVFNVCRRVLGDAHEAEDVFQATFLVLVRRRHSIGGKGSVGGWLHGVAERIALRARAQGAARRHRESEAANMTARRPADDLSCQELRSALDEAIGTLPEKYRTPIVLCYLEGKSHNQAAKELGWPKNSVTNRLARARELLRRHLERRGITLAVGALATSLTGMATAAPMPALLTIKTVEAATLVAAGKTVAGGCISAHVLALAEEALTGMLLAKGKLLVLVMALGMAIGGAGWAGYKGMAATSQPPPAAKAQAPAPKKQPELPVKIDQPVAMDQFGDPLPEGAVARLGAARFRHEGRATRLQYTPDGKSLVGYTNSGVLVWDAATGKERYRLPAPIPQGDEGTGVSPDGTILAISAVPRENEDTKINLWQLQTGKKLASLSLPNREGVGAHLSSISFSPDGKLLALRSSRQGKAYVFELASSQVCMSFGGRKEFQDFYNVAVVPDSKTIVAAVLDYGPNSAGTGHGMEVWDITTGKRIRFIHDLGVRSSLSSVTAIAFAPSGNALAFGNVNHVFLFDPKTGKELGQFDLNLGHVYDLVFTPDSNKLLACGNGPTVIMDLGTGNNVVAFKGRMVPSGSVLALSPSGKTVAISGSGDTVQLWDMDTDKRLFTEWDGHDYPINSIVFSPDGKQLVSACDFRVSVWDTSSWQRSGIPPGQSRIWDRSARSLSFSPNGEQLAMIQGSKNSWVPRALICNMGQSIEPLTIQVRDTQDVLSATFSPDGRKLFMLDWKSDTGTGGMNIRHWVRHWDVATGKQQQKWTIPPLQSYRPFLSPDGKTVFSATGDGAVAICDAESGRERLLAGQDKESLVPFSCSPDSRVLACGIRTSGDMGPCSDVRLFEVLTRKEIALLRGQQDNVATTAWSPDGRLLAAGASRLDWPEGIPKARTPWGLPTTIRLWDTATRKELARFDDIKADVTALNFSPGGTRLVAGLRDGTLLVWNIEEANPKRAPGPSLDNEELVVA